MNYKEKILQSLFKPVLARNHRFKGLHAGETCYIFGSGASLKNMDLSVFSDHVSFGLNFFCLHQDFRRPNILYHVIAEPFFLYPFIKNPYLQKYQMNIMGRLFKKVISKHSDLTVFTSITNLFGSGIKNPFYLYNFGSRQVSRHACNISGAFSFMAGAFYTGIGLAINMGFKKAILVGCDYTFTPGKIGHFYTVESETRPYDAVSPYEKLFAEIKDLIEFEVITDGGFSSCLPYQQYADFSGKEMRYKENIEIVNPEYLEIVNYAHKLGQVPDIVYPTPESTQELRYANN